jgi:hypothetical protein
MSFASQAQAPIAWQTLANQRGGNTVAWLEKKTS